MKPSWLTFWTMMSTLMPALPMGPNTAAAMPGRSGTRVRMTLATPLSWAMPRIFWRSSMAGCWQMRVPGWSSKVERTTIGIA